MDVWFYRIGPADDYRFRLYDRSWTKLFVELWFNEQGNIECFNDSGDLGLFGPFPTGRSYPIMVALDLDAGTVSVWLDGVPVLMDQAHGVPAGAQMSAAARVQPGGRAARIRSIRLPRDPDRYSAGSVRSQIGPRA